MPVVTTVVLEPDRDGEGLVELVHSVDAQSVASADVEVLVPAAGVSEKTRTRLDELARRRPNVSVIPGSAADAAAAGRGTWLLALGPGLARAGALLQPDAIERLTAFGDDHDCEAVIARVDVDGGSRIADPLIADAPRITGITAAALSPGLVLLRREFAIAQGVPMSAADVAAALAESDRVGAAGAHESLTIPAAPSTTSGLDVTTASARWSDGVLLVEVSGTSASSGPVLLSIRHRRSRMEYWLPGEGHATDGRFTATARLDVRAAALGDPLPTGRWTVSVGVHGGDSWSPRVAVPSPGLSSALVDDIVVAVADDTPALVLDIGATTASPVPRLTPDAVRITESATGTLMEAVLPGMPSTGAGRVRGSIQLGRFILPGYLVGRDGTTVLECYLSGLAGTNTISTRFGKVLAPCGLDVTIDGVGQMSVSPTPPEALRAKPAAGPATSSSARGALQSIRRAVPAPLEPVVRKVRQNPTAKRLYRTLTGLR